MAVGFTFDQGKCTGCQACILACTIENGLDFDRSWRMVFSFNDRHHPDLPASHLSLACNHCDRPACLTACPASAYVKDPVTGFVVLDEGKCIGCRYCTWACPYGAPGFDEERGVVSKCTFCDKRQEDGLQPACVASCPTGALGIGKRDVQRSAPRVPGMPVTQLGPAISIQPVAEERRPIASATASASTPSSLFVPAESSAGPGLSMKSEWPLAAFTYLTTVLVALLASSVVGGQRFSLSLFLCIAAAAVLLSTAHLGRKMRAWHAVLNSVQSWLSREVLLFALLVGFGTLYLSVAPENRLLGALALAIGGFTLLSIDRVYLTLPLVGRRGNHSAGGFLSGVMLAAVFSSYLPVAGIVGCLRLVLYVHRKMGFLNTSRPLRPELTVLRVLFGFVVPGLYWSLTGSGAQVFVIATVLLGELIDRLEFYFELDVVTPEKQMAIDLNNAIADTGRSTHHSLI